MESSSKALLIAGGILITVLILSLFVYLYITMHNFSNQYNSNIDSQKLQAFNVQFEVYNGREDLTAQDIVTIAGLAREYNEKNNLNYGDMGYIVVDAPGFIYNERFKFMENNEDKYTCDKIEYNSKSGQVNYIKFEKNSN